MEQFERRSCHTGLHLPQELVVEILLRIPAKSVARFRSVSTTWLSISTDPSFVLAHARRAPKCLITRTFPATHRPRNKFDNLFFSFSASGIGERRLDQFSDIAISSCNGLILFWRSQKHPCGCVYYVLNLLTGLGIDVPNPYSNKDKSWILEFYYHRWTGEYRLLNLRRCKGPVYYHVDAAVLSLGGAYSWRQIKAKAPFVSLFYGQSRVQVNDHFYWTCYDSSKTHTILVFDILKETLSLMELPSYNRKTFPSFDTSSSLKYGLVDIDGSLCCWIVYRYEGFMENITIDIWAAVDGDEKWKNTYSLCLIDEQRWALDYPFRGDLAIDCCLCVRERELLFLFDGRSSGIYSFHWDLKSGKCWTELLPFNLVFEHAIEYRETLVDVLSSYDVRA